MDKTSGVHQPTLGGFKSIRQIVCQHIREQILSGELPPGSRLVETEIAAELGVSRTPLREAFRELESEGLIVYTRHQGVQVASLQLKDMEEIYEIRRVLEGLAARLAATRRTDQDIEAMLNGPVKQMEKAHAHGRVRDIPRAHTEFNELLYRMAGNDRLHDILHNYRQYTERSQMASMTRPGRAAEIIQEHREIAEAIQTKDPDRAQAAAEVHVANARIAFLAYEAELQDAEGAALTAKE
jgi:DNA-binding GntR family transcriptional regulator